MDAGAGLVAETAVRDVLVLHYRGDGGTREREGTKGAPPISLLHAQRGDGGMRDAD